MNPNLKPATQMPGSFGLPIVGETWKMFFSQGWQFEQQYRQYGPVFKSSFLGKKYAILVGPEAAKLILQEQADRVSSYLGMQIMEPFFGRPMLLQDGETHRATRKLMAPAFHGKAIASYFDAIQHITDDEVNRWNFGQPVPLMLKLRKLALTIGIQLFLGVERNDEIEQVERWYNILLQAAFAPFGKHILFTPLWRWHRVRPQLKAFMHRVIQQRQQQGNLQESKDVLGLFLTAVDEAGNPLPVEQIIDELLQLVSGAHFTVARALTWSMVELAANPNLRVLLQEELQRVVGSEPLKLEHLREFQQIGAFLKEIERLYNPAGPIIARGVVQTIEYGGYAIPPGWTILVAQAVSHRLPTLFENPAQFDPSRFAPPREEDKKEPFSLIGFGVGAHRCIGMEFGKIEMKIFLAKLLRHYHWTVTPSYADILPIQVPTRLESKFQAVFTL
jgi:retinoid hydroxylase